LSIGPAVDAGSQLRVTPDPLERVFTAFGWLQIVEGPVA